MPIVNLTQKYQDFCQSQGISFKTEDHVKSYDESTLFCPAGMQQFKKDFLDPKIRRRTLANIQSCLRLNDYDEIGDGTHLLHFRMMGLFSFRHWTVEQAIDFWMTFLHDVLYLPLHRVTIHPDRLKEWSPYYQKYQTEKYYPNLKIEADSDCRWSDDSSKTTSEASYCTEFYIDDVEVGNIVNPYGDCIDVGFGYERLDYFLNRSQPDFLKTHQRRLTDKTTIYLETCQKILESGYQPGPNRQGYVLRKLLRDLVQMYQTEDDDRTWIQEKIPSNLQGIVTREVTRQQKCLRKYLRLIHKFPDRSADWWYETHGIDVKLLPTNLDTKSSASSLLSDF